MMSNFIDVDVVVIGAGQAGLAAGFFLHRLQRDVERGKRTWAPSFVLLDSAASPGGAWQHYWSALELFSPAEHSSLPGFQMPRWTQDGNPDPAHVVGYLTEYERRYQLPIHRDTRVVAVAKDEQDRFEIRSRHHLGTAQRSWRSRILINATGSWEKPFTPTLTGQHEFEGQQIHSQQYRRAQDFSNLRVGVVGAGNSGAQIAAELAPHASAVTWFTAQEPHFMPDDVDGRVLFGVASSRVISSLSDDPVTQDGRPPPVLGKIVATPLVRHARDAGHLVATEMFTAMTPTGVEFADGQQQELDAVIWCTGFNHQLDHLSPLQFTTETHADLPTRSISLPNLYFLGYGDWCGPASATLVGVGVWARQTVAQIQRTFAE